MAKTTKNTYRVSKKGNYKRVARYEEGGNLSELNYSERRAYIEEKYAPFIVDAQMIFNIYESGIEYDYKGDRKQVTESIIKKYESLADYTEETLPKETIYEIQDWDLVRRDIDPETDEVIGETSLEELSADNTYNFSYQGLVDLNWRVYHDVDYDRFFYVITPHLGGDIRGNYGNAIILEGNDKEELFYRFYQEFISGSASIYFKFKDGSEIGFDSEQDSDVFYFRLNEVFEPTGMAKDYLSDFEKFETWYGDEFLEETVDIYLMRKGIVPKMMAGGSLYSDTPKAYIEILGYDEGKWVDLTDFADGMDVIDYISDWMSSLNKEFGGNREEYRVADYEGFGNDMYDEYMGSNEFDEIIEAYEKYKESDIPVDVIFAYRKESGKSDDSLTEVIEEMENNYFGKYDSYKDFGYEMVEQGVYSPSDNDVYITDTDKRILAGEESDSLVYEMDFEGLLNIAKDSESNYEAEKENLEEKITDITSEITDLTALLSDTDNDEEYETILNEIEEKEIELDALETDLDNIDDRFEDDAKEEARGIIYYEVYDRLENDLSSWLDDNGFTDDLTEVRFLSVDYENIGEEIAGDYLIIEYDGELYFFNNYEQGGRISANKTKREYEFYIVESSTKKLVSGYPTKEDAIAQRKLLVQQYPSMRFELYPLANLKLKTDLDVNSKADYVELSSLDKIKKVSVDAYRYGKEKVGQANEFLIRNDVKGKIQRGTRKVFDKTKQAGNYLQRQFREADFGDGQGKAKFFADGGELESRVNNLYKKSNFINDDFNWKLKLLEMFQDQSVESYEIYQSLNDNQKEEVLQELYQMDNDMGSEGDGNIETSKENLEILLEDAKNGKKYADGGMAGLGDVSAMLPNPLPMSTITPMATGGVVGQEIVFDDSGETNSGVIQEITDSGDYIVNIIDDRTVLVDKQLDVISFGKMAEVQEVEEEKGFFSFFKDGGKISKKKGYDVYDNKRMLQNQANEIEHHSEELNAQVKVTKQVPAWVIAKMERATADLSDITHYLDGENKMANGGELGESNYEIVALPKSDKFGIFTSKNLIRDFSGNPMKFDSINSAQDFINNIQPKYPYGNPKANAGMILMASELLKQQQPQQPQVVYYVAQPVEKTAEEIGITQDIPEMEDGGEAINIFTNDFCITNLIELANEIQPIKYFVTDRNEKNNFESKVYNGKLIIVFKEKVTIRVVDAINKFIERAEDCHHIFEQAINVSGSQDFSISINLLTDEFSDTEFNRGGKVYEFAPKKINLSKTKKIKTNLGDYNLGLITNDFVYFVNLEESDDNAQTIMYNKKGELLSDNYFATNDLFETLESQDTFEFIHPDIEYTRQQIINEN